VIACPQMTIEAPDDYTALDEAIENLYVMTGSSLSKATLLHSSSSASKTPK
jgi:hypothetical protein